MHLWDNNRERHKRKYLEKQSHLVIILYEIPGAMGQAPLNTEGLEAMEINHTLKGAIWQNFFFCQGFAGRVSLGRKQ